MHSGSNNYSGGNTVWYNYVTASAGTITNKSTEDAVGNFNTATESLCPKGWSLPSKKQLDVTTDIINFTPVLGGDYINDTLQNTASRGMWWGSEAYSSMYSYYLGYNGSKLYTDNGRRYYGFYIRCVSEEKTVTDLTYMQDMTMGGCV